MLLCSVRWHICFNETCLVIFTNIFQLGFIFFLFNVQVFFNSGLTNNKDDFELCLRAENVELPKTGYFGVSAATGGLAGKTFPVFFLGLLLIENFEIANENFCVFPIKSLTNGEVAVWNNYTVLYTT